MFLLSFRRSSDFWKREYVYKVTFEKEHSSPNLKVTAGLPVMGSFLPLFKNFLRILQLCHQYSQSMGVTNGRVFCQ